MADVFTILDVAVHWQQMQARHCASCVYRYISAFPNCAAYWLCTIALNTFPRNIFDVYICCFITCHLHYITIQFR